uniref:Uncharacterized protein n=1 Tax=Candidatus Kentrum sp. LFY TaxID=2126342 RepID=A0A450VC63_9GAMM|nr:MAG: hypothetical protein BECKLFY1418A_GA0070994_11921 [Candidatus Kentron sp. LFY]
MSFKKDLLEFLEIVPTYPALFDITKLIYICKKKGASIEALDEITKRCIPTQVHNSIFIESPMSEVDQLITSLKELKKVYIVASCIILGGKSLPSDTEKLLEATIRELQTCDRLHV